MDRAAVIGCSTCGHLACVCSIKKAHEDGCPFLVAATGIGIACDCEWPRDVCPKCDPCTCASKPRLPYP